MPEKNHVIPFQLQRIAVLMEPELGNPNEIEGVLNPAVIRGPDGHLYIFPRLVAQGNYSRIGISRVLFNSAGDPSGVERLGIALEPEADYELGANGCGGCEDPRITFIEPLNHFMMTYTALSPVGPRIALAISKDLFHWRRLGLAQFQSFNGIDFVHVDNKDACLFPVATPNHSGKLQLAILHRPLFLGTRPEEKRLKHPSIPINHNHESIWMSYCPMPTLDSLPIEIGLFNSHHRLASPVSPWEELKIGCGTPPILTQHGWLIIYHGVAQCLEFEQPLCYSAGAILLAKDHPQHILYRSTEPILSPLLDQECHGAVANVVFPTGIDCRKDLGLPHRFDVYYGMADNRIGVAKLTIPESLAYL